jgi:PAT family acetyl-CoA transporter-like MFS transporter 1
MQSRVSYTQIGIFSLASYPYSFKLLWSPIVDSLYWARLGRRKSWIVPLQVRRRRRRGPGHAHVQQ